MMMSGWFTMMGISLDLRMGHMYTFNISIKRLLDSQLPHFTAGLPMFLKIFPSSLFFWLLNDSR